MMTAHERLARCVAQALDHRSAAGEEKILALGQPFDGCSLDRWVTARLLTEAEALSLSTLGLGDYTAEQIATICRSGEHWSWDEAADDSPTLLEVRPLPTPTSRRPIAFTPPPSRPSIEGLSGSWGAFSSGGGGAQIESLLGTPPTTGFRPHRFNLGDERGRTKLFHVLDARDLLLGRDVIVQQRRVDGPLSTRGFIAAVRRQADLQCPHIEPVYELDTTACGTPFFATALPLPNPLHEVLKAVALGEAGARERWRRLRLLEALLGVSRGIAFAHRRGVIHRDLRPQHVRVGPFEEVQIGGWLRARWSSKALDSDVDAAMNEVDHGTSYLAPERLDQGLGICGAEADLWGLGALLYAVLTRRAPFAGRSSHEVVAAVRRGALGPPSTEHIDAPAALVRLCRETLVIDPTQRVLSAEGFAAALEDHLEGTRAAELRLEQAEDHLEDAREASRAFAAAQVALEHACFAAGEARAIDPLSDAARTGRERVRARHAQVARRFLRADDAYARALAVLPGHEGGRYGLGALYHRALQDAERHRLQTPAPYLRATLRLLGISAFVEALDAPACLELHTTPAGLEVELYRREDQSGVCGLKRIRSLGRTPITATNLRAGSTVLTLRSGGREVRIPVALRPGETHRLRVVVPPDPPREAIFVAPGPFEVGRTEDDGGAALPHGRATLPGYYICRDLVTVAAYGRFLDALHALDPARALLRAPKHMAGGPPLWCVTPKGYAPIRDVNTHGVEWGADHPIIGLTREDAEGYAAWRAAEDQRPWRLPTDLEWEKAARGADGRRYPWGDRPVIEGCVHYTSGHSTGPAPVGSATLDRSIYGVHDLAGTAREYVDGEVSGCPALRGGSWALPFSECDLRHRAACTPQTPLLTLGFRMAMSVGPAPETPPAIQAIPLWASPVAPSGYRPTTTTAGFRADELTMEGRSAMLGLRDSRGLDPARNETDALDQLLSDNGLDMGSERYVVGDEIARGSMGRVVLAYDKVLHRHVALKVLHDKHGRDTLSCYRFAMEARITGRLQHPSILPIYDVGVLPSGARFFAMKPIEGLSLSEIFKARAAGDARTLADFGTERLVTIMRRVCQGIAFAHAHDVVHRDLKPANVLIGELGEVTVVDLGLARQLKPDPSDAQDVAELAELSDEEGRVTRVGSVIGTPFYMSPEQAMGLQDMVGPQSDVYGLGAILYHALALRPPYLGRKIGEVLAKVRRGKAPPPSMIAPEQAIPAALDRVVMKALSLSADVRYERADEMAADLAAWLEQSRSLDTQQGSAERAEMATRAFDAHEQARKHLETQLNAVAHLWGQLKGLAPEIRRRQIWDAQRQVDRAEAKAESSLAEVVRRSRAALVEAQPQVWTRLCMAIQRRYLRAEVLRDEPALQHYAGVLRRIDRGGVLGAWLDEGAYVSIVVDGGRAKACVHRTPPPGGPRKEEAIARGTAPLRTDTLHPGGGLVVLTQGERVVHVPFVVGRQAPAALRVRWPQQLLSGFNFICAGRFLYGGDPIADEGRPPRSAELGDYQISTHPVTCAEYQVFLMALQATDPAAAQAKRPRAAGRALWSAAGPAQPLHPVTGVTLADAVAYARWWGAAHGVTARIPTSAEWGKAARGIDGRRWPWGDEPEPTLHRHPAGGLHDVGLFPADVSPYGMRDLCSGVFEWTLTAAQDDPSACYLRGTSAAQPLHQSGCSARLPWMPRRASPFIGFRLVVRG